MRRSTAKHAIAVRFFDRQDEANTLDGARIDDSEELAKILDGLRGREPFICELESENGYNLHLGLGNSLGCVQHSAHNGEPPYMMALAPDAQDWYKDVEFLIADTLTGSSTLNGDKLVRSL